MTNSKKKKLTLMNFLPVFLWASFIFILSSQSALPSLETNLYDFLLKKIAHMFVYAVLFLLTYRAFRLTYESKDSKIIFLSMGFCLIFALSDELHQATVPGRYATLRDVGYDSIGVLIAFLRKFKYI